MIGTSWIKTQGGRVTISVLGGLLLAPAFAYAVFILSFYFVKNLPDGQDTWGPAIFGILTLVISPFFIPFGLYYLQKRFIR